MVEGVFDGWTPPVLATETADAQAICDFESIARKRMDPMAWEYISAGAADEITLRWNLEAYTDLRLNPRILRDVSVLDTSLTLLGESLKYPILLAPSALHKLATPDGELATAKGAGDAEATMVLSTMSSTSVEDVTRAATHPVWFQLYVQRDLGFTKELVQRAQASGCKALVVTVDTPVDGARNREQRARFHLPPGVELANLKGLQVQSGIKSDSEHELFDSILPTRLTWKEIELLQSMTSLPVILKGIMHPDDADQAVKIGAGAVFVSNHGARNLDTGQATLKALPRVADKVAGRIPVLMDGGIRRGTDVLKALALGANAVLIGRPVLYALSAGGAGALSQALHILRHELEEAMALTGRAKLSEIDSTVLWS